MAKQPAPSDIADKFMLRLPDGMRERIAAEAKANNRSMNAEIVARLSESLERRASDSIDSGRNEQAIAFAAAVADEVKKAVRTASVEGAYRVVFDLVSKFNTAVDAGKPVSVQDALADIMWDLERESRDNPEEAN